LVISTLKYKHRLGSVHTLYVFILLSTRDTKSCKSEYSKMNHAGAVGDHSGLTEIFMSY
jgi:hypothetical protein